MTAKGIETFGRFIRVKGDQPIILKAADEAAAEKFCREITDQLA